MTDCLCSVCISERLLHLRGMSRRRMRFTAREYCQWAERVTVTTWSQDTRCFWNGWLWCKPAWGPPPVLYPHLLDGDHRHTVLQLLDSVQQARSLAGWAGGGADAGEAHGRGAEPAGEAELRADGASGHAQEADRPEGWGLQPPRGQAAGPGGTRQKVRWWQGTVQSSCTQPSLEEFWVKFGRKLPHLTKFTDWGEVFWHDRSTSELASNARWMHGGTSLPFKTIHGTRRARLRVTSSSCVFIFCTQLSLHYLIKGWVSCT